MGPPERQPPLPRWQVLEELDEGEIVEADDRSIGSGGPVIVDCNWLQHWENVGDPFHVPILHGSFSGTQFVELMGTMPKVDFASTDISVKMTSVRPGPDGRRFERITEAVLPTIRAVPSPRVESYGRCESLGWVLPIDDGHFRIYTAGRVREAGELIKRRSRQNGKLWEELTPEEHQKYPGDYEAQTGQGVISIHGEEHLASSDQGVVAIRRMLRRQIEAMQRGEDPAGAHTDGAVVLDAGNWLR